MTSIPVLEIIFAIFLTVMPEGTKTFVVTAPQTGPASLAWTLQKDGTWSGAISEGNTAIGVWKADGMILTRRSTPDADEVTVDLSGWVKKEGSSFLINGIPLKIEKTDKGEYLFSATEGEFSGVIRIKPEQ